jgi:NAD-dependent deacetylase
VLAQLEQRHLLKAVITQNVDSLHQGAGSSTVIEYHGHGRTLRCEDCGQQHLRAHLTLNTLPPRCGCGGPLRPNFVFFGEVIPPEIHRQALEAARSCDLMVIVGTSGTVAPASSLPAVAKERGAYLLEINPERTDISTRLADMSICEPASKALLAIWAALDGLAA